MVGINERFNKMPSDSNFVEEEYADDVRYVNELEKLKMIVNSEALMLIVSAGWLQKYLREMEVDKKDVQEK